MVLIMFEGEFEAHARLSDIVFVCVAAVPQKDSKTAKKSGRNDLDKN